MPIKLKCLLLLAILTLVILTGFVEKGFSIYDIILLSGFIIFMIVGEIILHIQAKKRFRKNLQRRQNEAFQL